MKKTSWKKWTALFAAGLTAAALTGCGPWGIGDDNSNGSCNAPLSSETNDAKPVIYLYPESQTDVTVTLDYAGTLTTTYPAYNGGWEVTAFPDGTLINHADEKEYSYLFWEGDRDAGYDLSEGWCVPGNETAEFLQETLAEIGLTPREYNEFIVYWLPLMENNPYNLITFQGDAYTDGAKLSITPKPDSLLRVFMAWMPLEEPMEIDAPEIKPFERNGFTVVEWGGVKLP